MMRQTLLNKVKLLDFSWIFVSILMVFSAQASNTIVYGVAPRAWTMSAFTAVADDPSAVYYNPAGLAQVKGAEIDNGVFAVFPDQKYVNNSNVEADSKRQAIGIDLFISRQLPAHFTFGFGVYAPFARGTNYARNAAFSNLQHSATILRLDSVPTIAYEFNSHFSIGVGLVLSYIKANQAIQGLSESGHGFGVTGQVGALFKIPHGVRLGLTYRGPETATVRGRGYVSGQTDRFKLYDRYPATLSAGVSWQINPAWLLSFAYDYEFWDFVNEARRQYNNSTLNSLATSTIDGKNAGTPRAGIMYTRGQNEFRAGYAYVPAAIPKEHTVPAKPDYNVNVFDFGYSRYYKQHWRFDLGYEIGFSNWRTITGSSFPGRIKLSSVQTVMLGLGYKFGKGWG